jgi:tRNA A37 N6-isopentenylltransferase MiaA
MERSSGVFPAVALTCAALFSCSAAYAQDAPDLATLEQTAQKRNTEWEALARDMNERMARILPCDPRALAAVNEVSRASEERLGALADYLRAVSAKAFAETATVRNLLDAEEKRAVEAGLERADASQEQTAVNTQSDDLAQSVKQRTSLEVPQKLLAEIAAMIHQRAAASEQQAGSADAAVALLRDLVAKFEARDAALREEFAASEAERARWNGYYAARRARAQIECTITQIGGARPQGKR